MIAKFRLNNTATRLFAIVTLLLFLSALAGPASAIYASPHGATAPGLGTAGSYAVLGGQAVTNTGPSVITRDLGVSPGSAITGFPPGIVKGGAMHAADAVALQAKSDLTTAYNNLAGQACNTDLTGKDLGGKTLTPGVYCFSSSAQLTGKVTLDAQGNPGAVFIFQIASTLTTASASTVAVINGASACNAYWQIGSSATLGTGTKFLGNILALASISVTTGTSMIGRALARVGSVSLDNNNISADSCMAASTATPTATATASATATATATTKATATASATATTSGSATATATASATHHPAATATALPTERDATNTPAPVPSDTPAPALSDRPAPSPTAAPISPSAPLTGTVLSILHVPDTGGASPSGGGSSPLMIPGGLLAAGITMLMLGLRIWAQRRAARATIA